MDIFQMISEIPAVKDFNYEGKKNDQLDLLVELENEYYSAHMGEPNIITHDQTQKLDSLAITTKGQGAPEGYMVIDLSTQFSGRGSNRLAAGKLVISIYDKNGNCVAAGSLSHEILQAYLDGLDL